MEEARRIDLQSARFRRVRLCRRRQSRLEISRDAGASGPIAIYRQSIAAAALERQRRTMRGVGLVPLKVADLRRGVTQETLQYEVSCSVRALLRRSQKRRGSFHSGAANPCRRWVSRRGSGRRRDCFQQPDDRAQDLLSADLRTLKRAHAAIKGRRKAKAQSAFRSTLDDEASAPFAPAGAEDRCGHHKAAGAGLQLARCHPLWFVAREARFSQCPRSRNPLGNSFTRHTGLQRGS